MTITRDASQISFKKKEKIMEGKNFTKILIVEKYHIKIKKRL